MMNSLPYKNIFVLQYVEYTLITNHVYYRVDSVATRKASGSPGILNKLPNMSGVPTHKSY